MFRSSVASTVFCATALHLGFLGNYLAAYGGDPSAFVCADRDKIGRPPFAAIRAGFPNGGYDGQWYYVIARRPWARQSADTIDLPAYRQVRILYPALAWMLSGGGDPLGLFWVMPLINLAAIAVTAWYGARIAVYHGRSPWWGFALPIVLNAGMPALRDLTDPLATAALVAMLATYLLERPAWQLAVWAAAAALGREQNAVIIVFALFDACLRRRWRHLTALALGLAVWIGWVAFVRLWYGEWPTSSANVAAPFSGAWQGVTHLTGRYGRPAVVNVIGMLILMLQFGLCVLLLLRRPQVLTAGIAVAGIALALLGGPVVYESAWSYARVFVWMPLAVWLWSMQTARSSPTILLTTAIIWPLLASVQAWLK
jgi:hypothetical protein